MLYKLLSLFNFNVVNWVLCFARNGWIMFWKGEGTSKGKSVGKFLIRTLFASLRYPDTCTQWVFPKIHQKIHLCNSLHTGGWKRPSLSSPLQTRRDQRAARVRYGSCMVGNWWSLSAQVVSRSHIPSGHWNRIALDRHGAYCPVPQQGNLFLQAFCTRMV